MIEGTVDVLNKSLSKAESRILVLEQTVADLLKSFHMLQQVMVVHTEKFKHLEPSEEGTKITDMLRSD
tara:strand:+ start:244 stop:447 length:204 start_codon:yes stop_codon:yes gene_type:complete